MLRKFQLSLVWGCLALLLSSCDNSTPSDSEIFLIKGSGSAITRPNEIRTLEEKRQHIQRYLTQLYNSGEATTELGKLGIAEVAKYFSKQAADLERANGLLTEATKQNDPEAMAWLGQLYYAGLIDNKAQPSKALSLFRTSHEMGNVVGTYQLGVAKFEQSTISDNDEKEEAIGFVRSAYEAGFKLAQSNLGRMLTRVGQLAEARSVLEDGVNKGDIFSMVALSELEDVSGNQQQRIKLLEDAWSEGWAEAGVQLYSRYFLGDAVKKDYSKARKYLLESAELGSGDAYAYLCAAAKEGDRHLGVKKDIQKAIEYCKKGVEFGSMFAPHTLAGIYLLTLEDDQLIEQARELMDIAVLRKNAHAMNQYAAWLLSERLPRKRESAQKIAILLEQSAILGWPDSALWFATYSEKIGNVALETLKDFRRCWFWMSVVHTVNPGELSESAIIECGKRSGDSYPESMEAELQRMIKRYTNNFWVNQYWVERNFGRENHNKLYGKGK